MTRVEAIILAVEGLLTGLVGIDEAGTQKQVSIFVDRAGAMTREHAPAINITGSTEDGRPYGGPNSLGRETMQNVLRLELEVYTRGAPPLLLGERNFGLMHKRLLADRTLGGIVTRIRYANKRWQKSPADEPAGWLIAAYDFIYTASDHDLA